MNYYKKKLNKFFKWTNESWYELINKSKIDIFDLDGNLIISFRYNNHTLIIDLLNFLKRKSIVTDITTIGLYLSNEYLNYIKSQQINIINTLLGYINNNELITAKDRNRYISSISNKSNIIFYLKIIQSDQNKLEKLKQQNGLLLIDTQDEMLIKLNIRYNRLMKVPYILLNLTNLEILILEYNDLVILPDTISNLIHLKKLNVRYNRLIKLPDTIVNLIHLDELLLDYNLLTRLPNEIGNIEKLKKLTVSNNNLDKIPISIINRKDIQLDVSNNLLESAPLFSNSIHNNKHIFSIY